MSYQKTISTQKSFDSILETSKMILAPINFALSDKSENTFVFLGSGIRNTQENPILGASKIKVSLDKNQLQVNCELDGAKRIRNLFLAGAIFITFFVPLINIIFTLLTFDRINYSSFSFYFPFLLIPPVLLFYYFQLRNLQKKTLEAIENFVVNISR